MEEHKDPIERETGFNPKWKDWREAFKLIQQNDPSRKQTGTYRIYKGSKRQNCVDPPEYLRKYVNYSKVQREDHVSMRVTSPGEELQTEPNITWIKITKNSCRYYINNNALRSLSNELREHPNDEQAERNFKECLKLYFDAMDNYYPRWEEADDNVRQVYVENNIIQSIIYQICTTAQYPLYTEEQEWRGDEHRLSFISQRMFPNQLDIHTGMDFTMFHGIHAPELVILKAAGKNVNSPIDTHGNRLAHTVQNEEQVNFLRQHGADFEIVNDAGQTPLQFVQANQQLMLLNSDRDTYFNFLAFLTAKRRRFI